MSQDRFLPYGRQLVDEDDIAAVVEVLRSDYLTTGPVVERFEKRLAGTLGARHAVCVSSGTAALHAACFAGGIGEGDEAIVPAVTFVATANCVRYLGGEPVFADVDPETGLVRVDEIERRCGSRTRAVLPVHLNGMPAAMPDIGEIAARSGLAVIEDAAHALGATQDGDAIGSLRHSQMATFSFHPVKHVTTAEGGAVATNDPELRERLDLFRNHGMTRDPERLRGDERGPWYYEQQLLGHNMRLSDLQCALGLSQLAKLPVFLARRRALAARYDGLLADVPHLAPVARPPGDAESAFHLYAVLVDFAAAGTSRAEVMTRLRERGVGTQVHYIPVPCQPYYRDRGWKPEDFPGALAYYERVLSLPLFAGMQEPDVDRVVEALDAVLRRGA